MEKKIMGWKTKGMNRDLSVSAFNPEFSFENRNLRLSTNEGNTLMSWVNERGTKEIALNIDLTPYETGQGQGSSRLEGTPIGTAILNHQLVIFTHKDGDFDFPDYIYVMEKSNTEEFTFTGKLLYNGNLNFSTDFPIETFVSYESSNIQKVYWTDGRNQPRVINIKADSKILKQWNVAKLNDRREEAGQYDPTIYPNVNKGRLDTYFDFVPSISFKHSETPAYYITSFTVDKDSSGDGIFAPGVIQYCYTYFNKNRQQSNVVDVSPLQYITYPDRGASPEDKVSCNFTITIGNPDPEYEYVRIYSIQRTSLDLDAIVKIVADVPIQSEVVEEDGLPMYSASEDIVLIDNGTIGSTIDPYELLYAGGKEIQALTMSEKSMTLFMGNITMPNASVKNVQDYFNSIREDDTVTNGKISFKSSKELALDTTNSYYSDTYFSKDKSSRDITTFKGGENYRFGFQLQKATGEWSEPIFLQDKTNNLYPDTNLYSQDIMLPVATATLDMSIFSDDSSDYYIENFASTYKRIRPVIVYPNIQDRKVLCQGVLNPTVFNAKSRREGLPYAQSSWYFRPYVTVEDAESEDVDITGTIVISSDEWGEGSEYVYEPDAYFIDTLENAYVLIGSINITSAEFKKYVQDLGYLRGVSSSGPVKRHYFDGIIDLGEDSTDSSKHVLAFIKKDSPWTKQDTNVSSDNYYVYLDITYKGTEERSFLISSLISTDKNRYLYYQKDTAEAKNSFVFKFYSSEVGLLWTVTFSDVDAALPTQSDKNSGGSTLRYTHYDTLGNTGLTDTISTSEKRKREEIQGYSAIYSNVFDTSTENVDKSNTQFFIDQSIVTFNSPDLEFDTDIQTFPHDNIKLRIVGAIPITANVSAHSIITSSNMLDAYHNNKDKMFVKDDYFGIGEVQVNSVYYNYSQEAGKHLVAEYLWNDVVTEPYADGSDGDKVKTWNTTNFMVYPWQRTGSLNNDSRSDSEASSVLSSKKESNALYSYNTEYFEPHGTEAGLAVGNSYTGFDTSSLQYDDISIDTHFQEQENLYNIRLSQQNSSSSEINYYPNIDTVLYNKDGCRVYATSTGIDTSVDTILPCSVSMKYKSGTHAVISLNASAGDINRQVPILPCAREGSEGSYNYFGKYEYPVGAGNLTFWGDTYRGIIQRHVDMNSLFKYDNAHIRHNFLWLGELYKEPSKPFGGDDEQAIRNNTWLIGGEAKLIPETADNIILKWTQGDTYYQRYDCLKTYAFTPDDPNQLVETLSFMCETHVNIEGRYDRNKGQSDNTNLNPTIFNLLNPIYSQKDNYFNYKKVLDNSIVSPKYPNYIYYSKTKTSGSDIDTYTNISLGSILELDGDKGEISAIRRYNDQLIAFQESGISQILYDENVQISSTQGVPIEIANSGKVQGKRYITDTIGCSNKWSIATTPAGLYFMDNNDKSIYLFNGQLNNLSTSSGMNSWCKKNMPSATAKWTPDNPQNFVSYYDKLNQEVLFINSEEALAYNEKFNTFTSFYSYEDSPYFCNLDDTGVWINKSKATNGGNDYKLWAHQKGAYSNFFDKTEPYSMTLIGNPEPQRDKIFTNLEFRATVETDGTETDNKFTPLLPFDSLETWDEYQHGIATLQNKNGHDAMRHHTSDNTTSLKRKFRIWRCDIPRDNADVNSSTEAAMGISRFRRRLNDRMRNPWMYLKLQKNAGTADYLPKTEIHDMVMTYFC